MKCSVDHLDTHKLHPLYAHYDGQIQPQPAYAEFDKRTGSLTAGWDGEIGNAVPMDVWEGKRMRWPISYDLTETEVNNLLDEIAEKITWDAEEEEWSVPSDDCVEQLIYNAGYNNSATSRGIWPASYWFFDFVKWDGDTVNLGCWTITATTSDTDLDKFAKEMQADANGDGVTLTEVDSYLSELRDEAIEKSKHEDSGYQIYIEDICLLAMKHMRHKICDELDISDEVLDELADKINRKEEHNRTTL